MGKIDCDRISSVLAGMEKMRKELEALESELRMLLEAPAPPETSDEDLPEELDDSQAGVAESDAPGLEAPAQTLEDIPGEEGSGTVEGLPDVSSANFQADSPSAGAETGATVVMDPAAEYPIDLDPIAVASVAVDSGAVGQGTVGQGTVGQGAVGSGAVDSGAADSPTPVSGTADGPDMSAADEAAIEVIAVEEPIDISEFDAPETDFSGLDAPTEIHAPEESHMPEESLAPERPRALEEAHKGKTVMESVKADKAVMDVMAERQAWRTDRPGSPIKNIVSAISLNDRVLLINVLFKEDPMLFQETIAAFNAMGSLDEAVSYIKERFPDWNLNSESVYRLMMAVRRKLK